MTSKIKKLDGTARQIDVRLSREKVKEAINKVLAEFSRETMLDGFRKGRAPSDLVYQKYKNDILVEVKTRLIPLTYEDALNEHNIRPVSLPEVSDVKLEAEGELSYTAKVDTHPELKVSNYKGIKITRAKITVTDKEIDDVLTSVQNINSDFKETSGPIEKGDFAVCDVEGFIDGDKIMNKKEKIWIEAKKESSILGLGEELCGLKKEDNKTIDVTFPNNYPDKKYAGKMAKFNVSVKETRKKVLPPLDDEFAKKAGKNTLNELRLDIKKELEDRKELDEKIKMKNQVMEFLLKKISFELPGTMVKRQLDVSMKKAEDELIHKGLDKKDVDEKKEVLREKLLPEAKNKIAVYFILDKIAQEEDIQVNEEEVNGWLSYIAAQYNQKIEDVKKYYEEHDLIDGVKEQIREDKTLNFLLDVARVTLK